jgi:hypothetical protein
MFRNKIGVESRSKKRFILIPKNFTFAPEVLEGKFDIIYSYFILIVEGTFLTFI